MLATQGNHSFEIAPRNPETSGISVDSPAGFSEEDPFRAVLQFLKKRSWIIGATLALGLLGGALVNQLSRKLYTALASIEVRSRDASSQFRLEQIPGLDGSEDTSERLDTEIEILRSRALAIETINTLHLESNPDFAPLDHGKAREMSRPEEREILIGDFRRAIKINRLGHTNIIQVFATSANPELARLMANTLIDRY